MTVRYSHVLIEILEQAWRKHPEERLGQFLLNLARNESGSVDQQRLWNMENEELLDLLVDVLISDDV